MTTPNTSKTLFTFMGESFTLTDCIGALLTCIALIALIIFASTLDSYITNI